MEKVPEQRSQRYHYPEIGDLCLRLKMGLRKTEYETDAELG